MNPLHAIILAAGKGERLSPLTERTNKVLIEVGGRALIDHMVESLAAAGVAAITIVSGHCAGQIESHVGDRIGNVPIRYVHNSDFGSTNNVVSLAIGLEPLPLGTPLLLIEGDLLLDPALIRRVVESGDIDAALVQPFRPGLDGTLAQVEDGAIAGLIMGQALAGLPDRSRYAKTVNVTRLRADTLDRIVRPALAAWIARGGTGDYYEAVFAALLADGSLQLDAVEVGDEAWAEIDDAQDLERARYLFASGGRRAMLDCAYGGYWNFPVLDYAYPRNMYFPTPAIEAELAALLPSLIGRYGSSQRILDEKLARYLECPADEVVLLNGLSQIYPWLERVYGGLDALIPAPCFGEYVRVWPDAATYSDERAIDIAELQAAAEGASLIVIVNPNNPTGTAIPSAEIVTLAVEKPGRTIIVDESFADFSDQSSLVEACSGVLPPNLLLLKSLGKSLGAAGLRLGYVRSRNLEIVGRIRDTLPVWNSNAIAEAFLEILPKHRRAIAQSLIRSREDRAAMIAALSTLPLVAEVRPSEANFLLVRLDIASSDLSGLLNRLVDCHGIYVKDVSARIVPPGAWVRLTVRTPADNKRLYAALEHESVRPAAICAAIHE